MQFIKQSEATAARRQVILSFDGPNGSSSTGVAGPLTIRKAGGSAVASGGVRTELSATSQPGVYCYEFTAGECDTLGPLIVVLHDSSNAAVAVGRAMVVPWDPYDAVRLGLTALPNANAAAANGLPTIGTDTGQINPSGGGVNIAGVVSKTVLDGITAFGWSIRRLIAMAAAGVAGNTSTAQDDPEVFTLNGKTVLSVDNDESGNRAVTYDGGSQQDA